MWTINLIILGLIVYGAFQYLKRGELIPVVQKTPLELLKERYARGEITREAYREMIKHV